MASINQMLNALKAQLVHASTGLTTADVVIGTVDIRKAGKRPQVFLTQLGNPQQLIDGDAKRLRVSGVMTTLIKPDGGSSRGDIEQLNDAYDPIHARAELLEPGGLAGAKKFDLDKDPGPTPVGIDTDGPIIMVTPFSFEYERARGTTGAS